MTPPEQPLPQTLDLLRATLDACADGIVAVSHTGGPALHNARYCEIFTVTQPDPPDFTVHVYNTIGLNDCPAEQWNAVDYNEVKTQTGALLSVPNGPRRWLIDAIAGGKADMVALGRTALDDPNWPAHARRHLKGDGDAYDHWNKQAGFAVKIRDRLLQPASTG